LRGIPKRFEDFYVFFTGNLLIANYVAFNEAQTILINDSLALLLAQEVGQPTICGSTQQFVYKKYRQLCPASWFS